jgi:aldose 1-epimerase
MYAALFMRRLVQLRHNAWQTAVKRSGLLIVIGAAAVLLLIAFGLKERGRGHLSQLKTQLGVNTPPISTPIVTIRPGGQDPVILEHAQLTHLKQPEFLSATLLPGRGMNVLQIKADLPQKGEVNLLASPPLEDAAKLLNGTGDDAHGGASLTTGGAIEVPWAGRMGGAVSPDGSILTATWQGHSLHLPVNFQENNSRSEGASFGGLLLKRRADSVKTSALPDGGQAQTIYDAGGFDGHWISHTEITTTVQLSSRTIDMSISARNTGNVAEPVGIGWHPRFAILSGDRRQALLKLPNALHVETAERKSGMPTGKLSPVEGTPYDFTGH